MLRSDCLGPFDLVRGERAMTLLDFQKVPYEMLCGCVGIITNDTTVLHSIIQLRIRNCGSERIVDGGCPICGGTGILPEYQDYGEDVP